VGANTPLGLEESRVRFGRGGKKQTGEGEVCQLGRGYLLSCRRPLQAPAQQAQLGQGWSQVMCAARRPGKCGPHALAQRSAAAAANAQPLHRQAQHDAHQTPTRFCFDLTSPDQVRLGLTVGNLWALPFPWWLVQVWKDVDGVLTSDPRLVSNTVPVRQLTFDEATELAFFGAQVRGPPP
jgi:hypothetical protein